MFAQQVDVDLDKERKVIGRVCLAVREDECPERHPRDPVRLAVHRLWRDTGRRPPWVFDTETEGALFNDGVELRVVLLVVVQLSDL